MYVQADLEPWPVIDRSENAWRKEQVEVVNARLSKGEASAYPGALKPEEEMAITGSPPSHNQDRVGKVVAINVPYQSAAAESGKFAGVSNKAAFS